MPYQRNRPCCSLKKYARLTSCWKGWPNGGHVTYLAAARRLGNRLIVGLNTDRSVRALKGVGRPVIKQDDRARVLAALAAVDAVVLFDEDTPLELLRAIRPDVLAKGSDYTVEQVVGAEEIKAWREERREKRRWR